MQKWIQLAISPSREKAKAFLERIKFATPKTLTRKKPNLDYSSGLIIRVSWLLGKRLAHAGKRSGSPAHFHSLAEVPKSLTRTPTETGANKIASITTDGAVTESQEFPGSAPVGITAGIGSQVLFLGVGTNRVYKTVVPR